MLKRIFAMMISVLFMFSFPVLGTAETSNQDEKRVVAYCNAYGYINWSRPSATEIPLNLEKMTHLNYGFGRIDETSKTAYFENELRLALLNLIAERDRVNPELKILLSISQAGFTEVAMTEENRTIFADSIKALIDEFGVDGVDLDWEYPTLDWWDPKACPEDKQNYTLLLTAIREAIGEDKLITVASGAGRWYPACINFDEVIPIVDYWNIMTYAFSVGRYHDANLYNSALAPNDSTDYGIQMHLQNGVAAEKINLGIPLYGSSISGNYPSGQWAYYYDQIQQMIESGEYEYNWDDTAKVPYLTKDGVFEITFDDERSIYEKADYIFDNNIGGVMYYETRFDGSNMELSNAIWDSVHPSSDDRLKIENIEVSDKNVAVTATGGGGDYEYHYYLLKDGVIHHSGLSSSNEFSIIGIAEGEYRLRVYLSDGSARVASEKSVIISE